LVLSHQYEAALAAYEAELEAGSKYPAATMASRAKMLLCVGRLEEALAGFRQANEVESRRGSGRRQTYIEMIGSVQWLLDRRGEAIQTMRSAVDGIFKGKIGYASTAGAIGQGLLLWYFATSEGDQSSRAHALSYLDRPDARRVRDIWPGAAAAHVLDKMSLEQLLTAAADSRIPENRGDLTKRRQRGKKCLALFYAGVKRRAEGDETGCANLMRQCYALENPIDYEEWYLARSEAERRS
jgi:hypothetical protein